MDNIQKSFWACLFALFWLAACSSNPASDERAAVKVQGEFYLGDAKFWGNKKINHFDAAKKLLKKLNYFGIKEELYCGCEFSEGKISKDAKCAIAPRKNAKRAYRIEFEHIVPFENQVGHTDAWRNGVLECNDKRGRKCASMIFSHLEADLWNLWPAAGELNADRSNFSYSMIKGERNKYGKCDFIVEDRKVEPRDSVKALIAYTYLYFQKTYARYLKTNYLSDKNVKLFSAWSKLPLTREQCLWAKGVKETQENSNDDLIHACQQQGLWPQSTN